MRLKCIFLGHTWWIQKSEIDPMTMSLTYSNYINIHYHCECLECGAKKEILKSRIVPDGSQELANRRAGLKAMRSGP